MKKIVLTFGLIAGAILSAAMIVALQFKEEIGFDNSAFVGYTSMVLAFLLIYFGIRTYRENVAGGTISFGRAFKVGALIALVASCCYVATWEVIYFNFTPEYLTEYQAHIMENARADGETEAQIAERKADMDRLAVYYQNPIINAAITFIEPLPVGLIIALVSAGVLSRRRSDDHGQLHRQILNS